MNKIASRILKGRPDQTKTGQGRAESLRAGLVTARQGKRLKEVRGGRRLNDVGELGREQPLTGNARGYPQRALEPGIQQN